MRSRLVIPAAILVAAAYLKGRQDAFLFAPSAPAPRPPAPDPSPESIRRAQAEAADAWEMGLADAELAATMVADAPEAVVVEAVVLAPEPEILAPEPEIVAREPEIVVEPAIAPPDPEPAPVALRPSVPELDPAVLSEWLAQPAGAAPCVVESGRFSLGGWATQGGHMNLCGVTFRSRQDPVVPAGRVRLVIEASHNVDAGGLVVLSDAGFAPDAEGFSILLAASGPGAFAASGRYELLAADAR